MEKQEGPRPKSELGGGVRMKKRGGSFRYTVGGEWEWEN